MLPLEGLLAPDRKKEDRKRWGETEKHMTILQCGKNDFNVPEISLQKLNESSGSKVDVQTWHTTL